MFGAACIIARSAQKWPSQYKLYLGPFTNCKTQSKQRQIEKKEKETSETISRKAEQHHRT